MTLKRKCAQRSCGREVGEVVFIRCDILIFFHHFGGAAWVLPNLLAAVARHPLRELERPSHNQRAPGRGRRDRRQEPQQVHQPFARLDLEAQAQRQGHGSVIQRRYEPGTGFLPKRAVHKEAQPPLAPPLQGAAVNAQGFAQALHPFGLEAMRHRRNQDDDQARIDASSHKAHRRRGVSLPAAFATAAQAETHVPLRSASGLAVVIAAVKLAAAVKTVVLSSLLDQITIDFF